MNNKAKDLEKAALGIAVMFGLYWLYSMVAKPYLPFSEEIKGVVGLAVLYGAGLGLFVLITKNVSKQSYVHKEKSKVPIKTVSMFFAAMYRLYGFECPVNCNFNFWWYQFFNQNTTDDLIHVVYAPCI
jgi:disulfide bond formation protein DsbB